MTSPARSETPDLFAPAANDPATPRQRHFAAATRWAKQLPHEKTAEDKRRARERMIAHLKAGLAGKGIPR